MQVNTFKITHGVVIASAISLLASAALADPITISENASLFGTLNQRAIPACGNNVAEDNSVACGPTAAVNSFQYLENRYPTLYAGKLIHFGDLAGTADNLSSPLLMDCVCGGGTLISKFISGKQAWINQSAPGTTKFDAQNFFANNAASAPNFGFLTNMLSQGADVELLLGFYRLDADDDLLRAGGHYITVTGATFNDNDHDGAFGAGDIPISISYVDPWGSNTTDPSAAVFGTTNLTVDPNTIVESTADVAGPDSNDRTGDFLDMTGYLAGRTTLIEAVVAETPIPEPGTFWLIATALIAMIALSHTFRDGGNYRRSSLSHADRDRRDRR